MKLSLILYPLLCGFLIIIACLLLLEMGRFEKEVPGWGYDVSRNVSDYLNEDLLPIILPEHLCKENSYLLIVVFSAPNNFDARKAIRETWGHGDNVNNSVSVKFLIGETSSSSIQENILMESIQFEDIIQENFVDSYYNLTLKAIYMLKVAVRHCANAPFFLLKTDDDMFVNIPRLMKMLYQTTKSTDLLLGRRSCGKKTDNNPFSKWYTPKYIYSQELLPFFLTGAGYLMSSDVVEMLYAAAKFTPIVHLEDVYITGICAKNAGIKPQNNGDFHNKIDPDEPCLLKNLIMTHSFTPDRMRTTFKELENQRIVQNCENYEPMFNAPRWLLDNILMPSYRLGRRRECL